MHHLLDDNKCRNAIFVKIEDVYTLFFNERYMIITKLRNIFAHFPFYLLGKYQFWQLVLIEEVGTLNTHIYWRINSLL